MKVAFILRLTCDCGKSTDTEVLAVEAVKTDKPKVTLEVKDDTA